MDAKWGNAGEFKTPAIMSAVWQSDKGKRRVFIVNTSGDEQQFKFKTTANGKTHSVTLPPRDIMVRAED